MQVSNNLLYNVCSLKTSRMPKVTKISQLKYATKVEIRELRKGETVYETAGPYRFKELLVIADPERVENQIGFANGWLCMTQDSKGKPIELFTGDGDHPYGPKLLRL